MTERAWVALRPRDTVFVRDGRSFDAAADTQAATVLPGPATTAGAVGAAFKAEPDEVRGPVFARRVAGRWRPYLPVPADLVVCADAPESLVYRLKPEELAGTTDLDQLPDDDARRGERACVPERWLVPPLAAEPAEPLTGWLSGEDLTAYLAGELLESGDVRPGDLDLGTPFEREQRVGLARDDRSARSGFLYRTEHLRPHEHWAFLAQYTYEPGWRGQLTSPVNFGGRGRLADAENADCRWPKTPDNFSSKRVLVYLATPALWPTGWHPPLPPGARLIAAATGKPEPVATLTPGPDAWKTRTLRWAVPAGSVFLLEFDTAERAGAWAASVHGTAYAPGVEDRLRTAGFGVVLTGVWK